MKRIMFVCHGNICRSPMAEMIFRELLRKSGREAEYAVSSAATSSEEIWDGIGNPVYPPAREELRRHGIPVSEHRAVQLTRGDYGRYDLFVGMDTANVRNMTRIFGADPEKKIVKLLSFTDRGGDVADPWYSDRFDLAYRDIAEGCGALLDALTKESGT